MVGIASIGRNYPSALERLGDAVPNLLTYLGVASVLGVAGSLLLARRVKRQTLGMEPGEITGLVENREAMLHGLKEGVVALDPQERITVVNDSARRAAGPARRLRGQGVCGSLAVEPALKEVLTEDQPGPGPAGAGGRTAGGAEPDAHAVARPGHRFRDHAARPDGTGLPRAGAGHHPDATDTLRAQAHEFANQLHTIPGLIQIGEYDAVVQFVNGTTLDRTRLNDEVTSRIEDPALAALLIAKSSLAAERGVSLQLAPESRLGRVDEELSRDLTTVVGQPGGQRARRRHQHLRTPTVRCLTTTAAACGSSSGTPVRAFRRRTWRTFSGRDSAPSNPPEGGRGYGLALSRVVCQRRGGRLTVHNDGGAVFTADALPIAQGKGRSGHDQGPDC